MSELTDWIHRIVDGIGGFHDLEKYEMPLFTKPRDEEIVAWTMRCLANPKCEGSQDALDAIIQRRCYLIDKNALDEKDSEAK